jgi:hypothetical protein
LQTICSNLNPSEIYEKPDGQETLPNGHHQNMNIYYFMRHSQISRCARHGNWLIVFSRWYVLDDRFSIFYRHGCAAAYDIQE